MSHKLRYTVTASFGGYFWSLMMVLVSVVSSLREGNIVSALAICVAWTHMNWAASRRLLSTPTTSCQGHCHRTRLVLQVDLDFWQFFTKIRFLSPKKGRWIHWITGFTLLSWKIPFTSNSCNFSNFTWWNQEIKIMKHMEYCNCNTNHIYIQFTFHVNFDQNP